MSFRRSSRPSGFHVRPLYVEGRARQLEVMHGHLPGRDRTQTEFANEERQSNHLHETSLGGVGPIKYGRIVYAIPHSHSYKVAVEDGDADMICARVGGSAALPFAVRDGSVLPPNTRVLVYKHPHYTFGLILGVVPDITEDSNYVHPDWISQGSNCGFKRERYYWELLTLLADEGNVVDFSNDRPLDSTALGELSHFAHTGGGFFMDPWMTFLRQDETCGMWMFYLDRMLRICGYNLDIRTAISEQIVRNDQGEGHGFYGCNAYPWQVMGAWSPSDTPHREVDDADVQYKKPYAKYEVQPEQEDLMPFYRTEDYTGYCGQGFLRQVLLPPDGKTSGLNRYADQGPENARIGVFREQIGYDGSYALESAHSIHLCKRVLIPIPKRLRPIEDEKSGDKITFEGDSNYKFASQYGDGPAHKIGNPAAQDQYPHYLTATALTDLHAYAFNWKGLHPFVYHQGDYTVPQEDEIRPFQTLLKAPTFTKLKSAMTLERPEPIQAKVDDRYKKQDYFETTAGISITPDGCIVIRDAYGASIRSGGGNWFFSCPGDFYVQTGRNIVAYGGDDIVLRARNSVDVTAAHHDVRIKAEYNCDILAGNNGQQGRLLLESQAPSIVHHIVGKQGEDVRSSGVIIKARHSQFVAMCAEIYLRTGSSDGHIDPGDITLDADKGQRDIRTVSRMLNNNVELWVTDTFPHDDTKKIVHSRSATLAQTPTQLTIGGGVIICQDGLQMKGWIDVVKGHIQTEFAPDYNNLVPTLDDGPLNETNMNIMLVKKRYIDWNKELSLDYTQFIQQHFYTGQQVGTAIIEEKMEFAPRTPKQQDTAEWALPETYWQQLARLDHQTPGTWTEPKIIYQGAEMMPHPGKAAWTGGTGYLHLDLNYHDVSKGLDEKHDVGGKYETPELKNWDRKKADGNYLVVNTD